MSCFLHGLYGCQIKCQVLCNFYDCIVETAHCDESFHCSCGEIYSFGNNQLSEDDLDLFDFNNLWSNTFEDSIFSNHVRKRIRSDKKLEEYVLGLLRNDHITGDEVKALLKTKYPKWNELLLLIPKQSTENEVNESPFSPGYNHSVFHHFTTLFENMTIPSPNITDSAENQYEIKHLLHNGTNTEDTGDLLHAMKISGGLNLFKVLKFAANILANTLAQEALDRIKGKDKDNKGARAMNEADVDEFIDMTVANQLIPKKGII